MSDFYTPPADPAALHAEALLQASCYSLPYGAVGFSSHLITYYTMICLICGRRPLWPWRRLRYPLYSAIPGIISLIGTTVVTSISINRCSSEKPFRLIGAWMMMTSIAVSLTTISAPFAFGTTKEELLAEKVANEKVIKERKSFDMIAYARMDGKEKKFPVPGLEVLLHVDDPGRKRKRAMGVRGLILVGMIWVSGSIMGVYGIILFCDGRWNAISVLNTITAVFGLVVFSPTILILCKLKNIKSDTLGILISLQLVLVCSLGLLWMDWTIGAMTGNLVGVPGRSGKDGVVNRKMMDLAWIYFALKRLPLLGL
ncbi:uncharacterized protein PAC_03574 [Phialocephala subalpina]|uniref:Uncharacterized protein n=1 Tax=Phialocephala subalpina TaxID=576137 RepID=A0A1L7WLP8_9HELO|nr:uncharacterized protein PAC_03574 [Phialocephala subalpina]